MIDYYHQMRLIVVIISMKFIVSFHALKPIMSLMTNIDIFNQRSCCKVEGSFAFCSIFSACIDAFAVKLISD